MSELKSQIQDQLDLVPRGTEYSVAVVDTEGRQVFGRDTNSAIAGASLVKLGIAEVAGHRMENDSSWLDQQLTIRTEDKVGGTGILQYLPADTEVSVRDTLHWMLAESDNTAAKMIVRELGGARAVNAELDSSERDIEVTRLQPLDDDRWYFGNTTSAESIRLFGNALSYDLFSDALHRSHCDYMLRQDIDTRHPDRLLDNIGDTAQSDQTQASSEVITKARRPRSQFPSKEGILEDQETQESLRHDVARIGRFTVAVLSRGKLVPRWKHGMAKKAGEDIMYGGHKAVRIHAAIGRILVRKLP